MDKNETKKLMVLDKNNEEVDEVTRKHLELCYLHNKKIFDLRK